MCPDRTNPSFPNGEAILADRVFDGRNWLHNAALLLRNGRIAGLGSRGEVPSDWRHTRLPAGVFLAPGFIDLQVNGGGGVLLNDEPTVDGMCAIAKAHRRFGTTACLPTLITDTRGKIQAVIAAALDSINGREEVSGLHLEGPFISPLRPGVHRPDRIAQPRAVDLDELRALAGAGRSVITLAPECVPTGFIRSLAAMGIRVSIGHSEASAAVVTQAIEDGANRRNPSVQRHAAIERASPRDRRRCTGGSAPDRQYYLRWHPRRPSFGPGCV